MYIIISSLHLSKVARPPKIFKHVGNTCVVNNIVVHHEPAVGC